MPEKKNVRKKKKKEEERSVDERTLRPKNGKITRASVMMCVRYDDVKNLRKWFPKTYLNFRIKAHERFHNYAQNVDSND